jgi:hypothetical protein
MRVTIVINDNKVNKDGIAYIDLDLSVCGIPNNVSALQWQDTSGWIEDKSNLIDNVTITELPTWATACITKWDETKAAEEAAILAAQQAAEAAKQTTQE